LKYSNGNQNFRIRKPKFLETLPILAAEHQSESVIEGIIESLLFEGFLQFQMIEVVSNGIKMFNSKFVETPTFHEHQPDSFCEERIEGLSSFKILSQTHV
jgi:hypothetical protein